MRATLRTLVGTPGAALTTLLVAGLLLAALVPFLRWAVLEAVWGPAPPAACDAAGVGACWAFVEHWWAAILFGTYPPDERWRPALAVLVFIALAGASGVPRLWGRPILIGWGLGLPLMAWLMVGGGPLPSVPWELWGGLPVTLMLAVTGCVLAFPLALLLALGRTSRLPALRTAARLYIELIRGVPLVTLLFMAAFLMPLFLPEGAAPPKLLSAQVALILFIAAYLAEVVRGGLAAVPKGQEEAAASLGLGYGATMSRIVLPQALRVAVPPMVNTFIGAFKDTSLVSIVGLADLMRTTRNAIAETEWRPYFVEGYLFAAMIYFAFCFALSRWSLFLERRLARGGGR